MNSIFTRKQGYGKLYFTIKSWTKGSAESLPSNAYAAIKLRDPSSKALENKNDQDFKNQMELLVENEFMLTTNSHLDQIEIKIAFISLY